MRCVRGSSLGQNQPLTHDRFEVTSVTNMRLDLLKTNALPSRYVRWLCTIASGCVSIGVATWGAIGLSHLGLSPSAALSNAARGAPAMMLWFLPLWAPELALGFVASASTSRWLRLICGAVGVGIGVALIVGLAAARANESSLIAIALTYLVLGAFNCWFGARSRRSTR